MNQKKSKKERQVSEMKIKRPVDKAAVMTNVVIGVVIAAFLGLGGYAVGKKYADNKANEPTDDTEYTSQQSSTVQSAADEAGMSVEEYLANYGLDTSISPDTALSEIYPQMTVENMAKLNDTDVDTFREQNYIPDDITNDTLWGDVLPELPFKAIVGEEQVEQFKSVYGLGDEVTADTKWSIVEPILNAKQDEMNEAMANAQAANEGSDSDDADTDSEDTDSADSADTDNSDSAEN